MMWLIYNKKWNKKIMVDIITLRSKVKDSYWNVQLGTSSLNNMIFSYEPIQQRQWQPAAYYG